MLFQHSATWTLPDWQERKKALINIATDSFNADDVRVFVAGCLAVRDEKDLDLNGTDDFLINEMVRKQGAPNMFDFLESEWVDLQQTLDKQTDGPDNVDISPSSSFFSNEILDKIQEKILIPIWRRERKGVVHSGIKELDLELRIKLFSKLCEDLKPQDFIIGAEISSTWVKDDSLISKLKSMTALKKRPGLQENTISTERLNQVWERAQFSKYDFVSDMCCHMGAFSIHYSSEQTSIEKILKIVQLLFDETARLNGLTIAPKIELDCERNTVFLTDDDEIVYTYPDTVKEIIDTMFNEQKYIPAGDALVRHLLDELLLFGGRELEGMNFEHKVKQDAMCSMLKSAEDIFSSAFYSFPYLNAVEAPKEIIFPVDGMKGYETRLVECSNAQIIDKQDVLLTPSITQNDEFFYSIIQDVVRDQKPMPRTFKQYKRQQGLNIDWH